MAPRKLSDSDKRQITSIYCQPGETTSTLAQKFGISSSTVSRVLKQMLSDDEYAKLMKWKRSGERGSFPLKDSDIFDRLGGEADGVAAEALTEQPDEAAEAPTAVVESVTDAGTDALDSSENEASADVPTSEPLVTQRRSRRRSTAGPVSEADQADAEDKDLESEPIATTVEATDEAPVSRTLIKRSQRADVTSDGEEDDRDVAAWASESFEDEDDFDADSDDEDWEEDSWDEDADDEDVEQSPVDRAAELTILSFERFSLTKPCYLVVDRLAELITCPLKDFSELGMIPSGEEQARTLPVFDNHKIARRFARRNQRIIKVPDGDMLSKTQDYLQAKGITRILFDGQVYALNG
ncbi:MAG: transposase [Cyanobacteria bacterium P01_C01_bin.120]